MALLFLVHWDHDEAEARGQALVEDGWDVVIESERTEEAYRHIRETRPAVVVVDLRLKPDFGFRAADAVRRSRWGHEVPFIFIGGEDDDALLTLREEIPDATFIEPAELGAALEAFKDRPI